METCYVTALHSKWPFTCTSLLLFYPTFTFPNTPYLVALVTSHKHYFAPTDEHENFILNFVSDWGFNIMVSWRRNVYQGPCRHCRVISLIIIFVAVSCGFPATHTVQVPGHILLKLELEVKECWCSHTTGSFLWNRPAITAKTLQEDNVWQTVFLT